jgi:5-methylcytosine-specific restriction enzyme B
MPSVDHFGRLADIVARGLDFNGADKEEASIKAALAELFGRRYQQRSRPKDAFRDAYSLAGEGVPYAGMIAPENATSGAYGGASLAWFPCVDGTLVTLVVGTKGLAPDEGLLTRHGHRRRVSALRHYLASKSIRAWAKSDPSAIGVQVPRAAREGLQASPSVFDRYGDVIYSMAWVPKGDIDTAATVISAYVDVYAHERGWEVLADARASFDGFIGALQDHAFPSVTPAQVNALLRQRHFVVLQGPPGTGKTRMAEQVRREHFANHGRTVQFHPAVTYEDFVVGLSPDPTAEGLRFRAKPGWLLQAASESEGRPYLLVIDEVNRGDLSKVLGEAIYLFEPREVGSEFERVVQLPHEVDGQRTFSMPANLYVLGTMNTADRSIAGMDLAVRRRFAFMTLMPDGRVLGEGLARGLFEALRAVFIEHAPEDMLHLLPGHSYFLADDEAHLRNRFRYELVPLLEEYLRQGLLGPASIELHAVMERIRDVAEAD